MFEDALFATNRRRTPEQRWAAVLSFALQAAFVTVIVGLPLFFTDALPLNLRTLTELPSVPRSAGPPKTDPAPKTPPQASTSAFVGDHLIFHEASKGPIKPIVDLQAPVPPCVGTCVEGSTGPGPGQKTTIENIIGVGPATSGPPPKPQPPKPVRVSVIDEGLLIRKVTPAYPQIAITTRQQGTVLLHAIIGRDGTIQQLQVISGPPLLTRAAMEAVSQWRYRPYILNGEPVEVDTQITVNFKLGG